MRRLTLDTAPSIRGRIVESVRSSAELSFLHRLHCVLLVAEGRSCYEVAKWFATDARTVERWVHAAADHGLEGLRAHVPGGRPRLLAGESLARVAGDLQRSPAAFGYRTSRWSGALLSRHLRDRYATDLGTRQCQRLLREALAASGRISVAVISTTRSSGG